MGIENLFLCSIFFENPADLPMFGNGDSIKRAEIYNKSNNVGISGYQTFLTSPQPAPLFEIKTPSMFAMGSVAKPVIKSNSVNYFNQNDELLGGIVNLNLEELQTLISKHISDKNK